MAQGQGGRGALECAALVVDLRSPSNTRSTRAGSRPVASRSLVDVLDALSHAGVTLTHRGKEHVGPCWRCGGRDRFHVAAGSTVAVVVGCRGCGADNDEYFSAMLAELFPAAEQAAPPGGVAWRQRTWTCVNPLTGATRDHLRTDLWPRDRKIIWGPGPDSPKDLIYRARLEGSGPLIVCEGEPDADAVAAHGVDAIGIVTGAPTCPHPGALADCADRTVILWPDPRRQRAAAHGAGRRDARDVMTKRPCLDCGADISNRGYGAKRCKAHAYERERKTARRWPQDNREKHRENQRRNYKKNGERYREKSRKWATENPEKNRERVRQWKTDNPEKVSSWSRNYRAKNLKKMRMAGRLWAASHPEYGREYNRKKRARKRKQLGVVSLYIERSLLEKQKSRCAAPWCRKSLGRHGTWHLDHIVPLKLGGLHDDANLQILCVTCNLKKNAQHPDDWQKEHGMLPLLNTGE